MKRAGELGLQGSLSGIGRALIACMVLDVLVALVPMREHLCAPRQLL